MRFFTGFLLPLHFGRFFQPFFVLFFNFSSVVFFSLFSLFFPMCFVRCFGGEGVLEFYDRQAVWCNFKIGICGCRSLRRIGSDGHGRWVANYLPDMLRKGGESLAGVG